jgi:hypothetical protein
MTPDAKERITLDEITNNVSSYRVTVEDNGKITLEPYAEIPLAKKWIFKNKKLLEISGSANKS